MVNENQKQLQENYDDLQIQYDMLLGQNVKSVEENQYLMRELSKSKVEIKDLNE